MRTLLHEGRYTPPLPAGVNPVGPLPTRGRLRRRLAASIAVLASAWMLAGCVDDLPKATEIARMRILGAQLSVLGDETRTTPKPGETVHVALSTQFPSLENDRDAVQSLLITCTAPDRFTGGIPICQELIDVASAPGASAGDIALPPGFDKRFACESSFGTPVLDPVSPISLHCQKGEQAFDLGVPPKYPAHELLFVGIVCERGAAVLDPALPGLFGCEDASAEPIPFHGLVRVQHAPEDENHNPDMSALRLVREVTGLWEPVDPAALVPENEMCAQLVRAAAHDPKLPWVIGSMDFGLRYMAKARELVDGVPEELEFTVYATDGDIERRFTLFRSGDKGRELVDPDGNPVEDADGNPVRELHDSLRWKSPKLKELSFTPADPDAGTEAMGSDGKLVRVFVTLRDGRGGFGQTDYALCALNKAP